MDAEPYQAGWPERFLMSDSAARHACVTSVRLRGYGRSAAALEAEFQRVAQIIFDGVSEDFTTPGPAGHIGEQVIERDQIEPEGDTAFRGRAVLSLYLPG